MSRVSGKHLTLKALPNQETKPEIITGVDKNKEVQSIQTNLSISEDSKSSILGMPKATAQPLSLLLFSQFILFIGVGAVIPTLPLYGKAIGLSSAANGLVISAPALALLLLAQPAGKYADLARKPAMIWGMAVIAISDLGTALAGSLLPLIIARLGLGAGRCISESGERGMLADFAGTAPEVRGRTLAAQQAVLALGIAIGAPVGGLVVEAFGPRAAFLCVTAAALLTLTLYLFLPETVEKSASGLSEAEKNTEAPSVDWGNLIEDPKWQGLSLFEVGEKFGFAAKLASIPVIAASVLPGGAVGAGALLSAAGLSGLVGAPLGGWVTDRIGSKNSVIASGVLSSAGLIAIPFALQTPLPESLPEGAAFAAAVLLWSTAVAAQKPAATALAQEYAPDGAEATAMALPRACGDAVYLFAPFMLGYVADWAAAPTGLECAVAGICGLLGTAALIIL
eukprot:CAMPEP_0113942246 /NCGR_PEP_ID=MMETSP1339-20121228/7993_1 /TAXON_ID=94617 /ORGANISM="Fibrocapsa japonica" /LENGTH=452 /DNA_ID=CAMNT_0000946639 /DNA_START=185 /DNA_END=1543 /DNA_ORIENTATION=+ /assembly_acc=CAM_ASM_000762